VRPRVDQQVQRVSRASCGTHAVADLLLNTRRACCHKLPEPTLTPSRGGGYLKINGLGRLASLRNLDVVGD
jgi:hypothetical protein